MARGERCSAWNAEIDIGRTFGKLHTNTVTNTSPWRGIMRLRIREWRQHFQMSQAALAADCGLSRETISAIETNRQPVNTDQLEVIAAALHLRVSDLLDESPCPHCPFRHGPPPPAPGPDEEPPVLTLHRAGQSPEVHAASTTRARMRAAIQRAQRAQAQTEALLARLGRSAGVVVLAFLGLG